MIKLHGTRGTALAAVAAAGLLAAVAAVGYFLEPYLQWDSTVRELTATSSGAERALGIGVVAFIMVIVAVALLELAWYAALVSSDIRN